MVEARFHFGAEKDALAIREEVFMQEQGYDYDEDEFDPHCWSLVVYLDHYPIATGRLIEMDPETYRIGRLAVRKGFRHQKVGSYTMKFLMSKARELGARKAIVHAQVDKREFYETLGFRPVDGEIYLEDGTPHITLLKSLIKKRKRK